MIWQPLNLSDTCPANSSLTACSAFGYSYLNLLVQLFGGSLDERIQKKYQYKEPDNNSTEYDFIVVGAGAAGCVVAHRLTDNTDWKALLLEAGPEQPDVTVVPALSTALIGSNIHWGYTTEPNGRSCLSREGRCSWAFGKTMGGSSSVNAMAFIRGNKKDYDGWSALGNEGWSYKEVLPFFKKSEKNLNIEILDSRYHGVMGQQYVSLFPYVDEPSLLATKAFIEKGLPLVDYNGAQQEGVSQAQAFSRSGKRVSTNTAYIQPIRYTRKNLIVKVNSEAIKILIDENKRAYGVIYVQNGTKYIAYAKKEVIVSAGAVHSPKLLMLSGIGPKDHLGRMKIHVIQDSAVGENLHDHVSFDGVIVALPNKTATTVSKNEILEALQNYANMKIKRGPLSANGPLSTIAFIKTDPSLDAPDIEYHFSNLYNWREFLDEISTAQGTAIFPTAFYDALLIRTMNIVPISRGKLLLNESYPHGPPVLYPNYLDDERDLIPLLNGMKFLLSLEDTEAFRSSGAYFVREPLAACKSYEWGTDEYYTCLAKQYTATTYHQGGTCKMGPKWDEKAVVDNELRVYGVCGLRVVDASIMPFVVRGNTNAPTIMIGERGVDFVIKHWKKYSVAFCPDK